MHDAPASSPEHILDPEWTSTPEKVRQTRREALGFALSGASQPTQPLRRTCTAASSATRLRLITEALSNADTPLEAGPSRINKRTEPSGAGVAPKRPKTDTVPDHTDPSPTIPAGDQGTAGKLSKEQSIILELVQKGHSVFYTGSAGTGKSFLLREIISTLQRKYQEHAEAVAVTASTGLAACNIGGVTVHSFASIGPTSYTLDSLVRRLRNNKKAWNRWVRLRVWILDEISMIEADFFQLLHDIAMAVRKNKNRNGLPFGGIQMIVTGDFFQLPPVCKLSDTRFAFETQAWRKTFAHSYMLTHVFRQSDPTFVSMLNEMRLGNLSNASVLRFRALSRDLPPCDDVEPTELFPLKKQVDNSNQRRLSNIDTEELVFKSVDSGVLEGEARTKLLDSLMAPERLRLRIGAQVMLLKNLNEKLVNGTIGHVQSFVEPSANDETTDGRVATSRKVPRSVRGLRFPLVRFRTRGGGSETVLVVPEIFKSQLPDGSVQVSRRQVPLMLAWAMSIHKAQGQSLDRLKVDLAHVFEKGQAYVALSRATSLEGLQVLNFRQDKVNAHPKTTYIRNPFSLPPSLEPQPHRQHQPQLSSTVAMNKRKRNRSPEDQENGKRTRAASSATSTKDTTPWWTSWEDDIKDGKNAMAPLESSDCAAESRLLKAVVAFQSTHRMPPNQMRGFGRKHCWDKIVEFFGLPEGGDPQPSKALQRYSRKTGLDDDDYDDGDDDDDDGWGELPTGTIVSVDDSHQSTMPVSQRRLDNEQDRLMFFAYDPLNAVKVFFSSYNEKTGLLRSVDHQTVHHLCRIFLLYLTYNNVLPKQSGNLAQALTIVESASTERRNQDTFSKQFPDRISGACIQVFGKRNQENAFGTTSFWRGTSRNDAQSSSSSSRSRPSPAAPEPNPNSWGSASHWNTPESHKGWAALTMPPAAPATPVHTQPSKVNPRVQDSTLLATLTSHYDAGLVEISARRVLSIHPPSNTSREGDGAGSLASTLSRVEMGVLRDWDGGHYGLYRRPRFVACLPNGPSSAPPSTAEVITVLMDPLQVDLLPVGTGIGGTFVELAPKKTGHWAGGLWYLENLVFLSPSFWTVTADC